MHIPCLVLAFSSIAGGYVKTPFARFLETVLPWNCRRLACSSHRLKLASEGYRAWCFSSACALPTSSSCASEPMQRRLASSAGGRRAASLLVFGLGNGLALRPALRAALVWLARIDKGDFIDGFYTGVGPLERNRLACSQHAPKQGNCAGMPPVSRPDPLSLSRWCCSYDPPLAHCHPPRRRASRLGWQRARIRCCAAGSRSSPSAIDLVLALVSCGARFRRGQRRQRVTGSNKWIGIGFRSSASTSTSEWMASAFCSFCSRSFLASCRLLISWTEITTAVGFYHFNLLWILAGILGVFLSLDLFLFYFSWELMLVPMYFLISIWGRERRTYAAVKFFLFTQLSGLLMLIAILALYFAHHHATGIYTFEYTDLLGHAAQSACGHVDHAGLFHRLRGEAADVPVPYLAARCLRRGFDGNQCDPRQPAGNTAAYGMIRFLFPLFPGRGPRVRAGGDDARGDWNPLWGDPGLFADRSDAPDCLCQHQPPWLRAAGDFRRELRSHSREP